MNSTEIAKNLQALTPGELPLDIFVEFAKLSVTPVVEIVPINVNEKNGEIQILLKRRPHSDPIWPNLLHTPGTVVRSYDKSIDDAVSRVLNRELEGISTSPATFVHTGIYKTKRGTELACVYYTMINSERNLGDMHRFANLPSDLIESQLPFIEAAVQHFKYRTKG